MMISVIMLTYNRKDYVSGMIEDILNQSFTDFEFIIVDNGSNDGTSLILTDYAKRDSRIRIVTLEKSSIGRARNTGLREAKGDYIAYVDDDDRVEPDYLEFLHDLINDNNADISVCGTTEGDGSTRVPQCLFNEKLILTGEEATSLLIRRINIRAGIPAKLYRRKILECYPFVENYKNEDLHTQYKYLLKANMVAAHGIDKYYITRHTGNVSGFTGDASKWDAKTMQDYLVAYHNRTEFIKENAPGIYSLARYSEWSFMISMVDKISKFNLADCKELKRIFVTELKYNRDIFFKDPEIKDFEIEWMNKYIS